MTSQETIYKTATLVTFLSCYLTPKLSSSLFSSLASNGSCGSSLQWRRQSSLLLPFSEEGKSHFLQTAPSVLYYCHHSLCALNNVRPPWQKHYRVCCSLPFNGCGSGAGGGPDKAVGICQTRTLPAVSAPELAVPELKLAVAALNEDPPRYESGIIRLEVLEKMY